MGQLTFRGKLLAALGAALLILVCVAVLSYRRILQEDADQKSVEHTHLVLEKIDSVSSGLPTIQSNKQLWIASIPWLPPGWLSLRRTGKESSRKINRK